MKARFQASSTSFYLWHTGQIPCLKRVTRESAVVVLALLGTLI